MVNISFHLMGSGNTDVQSDKMPISQAAVAMATKETLENRRKCFWGLESLSSPLLQHARHITYNQLLFLLERMHV